MDNLFNTITKHLLEDEKPSIFLNSIKDQLKDTLFKDLVKLDTIEQELKYHPEGVVWNHIMLVVDEASKVKDKAHNKKAFMWAALLHDIGKVSTTKKRKGRWTSYNHDNVGYTMVKELLSKTTKDNEFIHDTSNLVKHHMNHIYITKNLPFGNIEEMIQDVDINDMLLIFYCDSLGRGSKDQEFKKEKLDNLNKIKEILNSKYSLNL